MLYAFLFISPHLRIMPQEYVCNAWDFATEITYACNIHEISQRKLCVLVSFSWDFAA
jgi:hypothetical protein